MSEKNYITVKSKLPADASGGFPVALWERDAAHPDGEVFIAGTEVVKAAPTAGVTAAIHAGKIEVVEGSADPDKLLADGASQIGDGAPPREPGAPAGRETTGTPLADDFPHRELLAQNGVTTVEQLRGLSDEEASNLEGIGEARREEIAKALRKVK